MPVLVGSRVEGRNLMAGRHGMRSSQAGIDRLREGRSFTDPVVLLREVETVAGYSGEVYFYDEVWFRVQSVQVISGQVWASGDGFQVNLSEALVTGVDFEIKNLGSRAGL